MTFTLPPPTERTTEKRIGIVTGVSPTLSLNWVIVPARGALTPLVQNSLSSRQVPRIGTGFPVRSLPHLTAWAAGTATAVAAITANVVPSVRRVMGRAYPQTRAAAAISGRRRTCAWRAEGQA